METWYIHTSKLLYYCSFFLFYNYYSDPKIHYISCHHHHDIDFDCPHRCHLVNSEDDKTHDNQGCTETVEKGEYDYYDVTEYDEDDATKIYFDSTNFVNPYL